MKGIVESGFGRGAKFVSMQVYEDIFSYHLDGKPYHGTLNLKLDEKTAEIIDTQFKNGIVYDNIVNEGKKMGGIILIPLRLECDNDQISVKAVGIRPLLTNHNTDVLEVIARENLRKFWDIDDGRSLKLIVA